eukprot:CAMPEP_0179042540 /NCGR_PEP_ID=MMETSP0796-20121207/16712_1 /TAXON_ID=73915 /ORGANISM="Pyrodinium bahamense, Strain pbaha01" /LENGTH=145 /DNA_ID=CAMNT_0020738913 /DNA_START=244 /DNA_END=681 /DNA_ORIENTATION=+
MAFAILPTVCNKRSSVFVTRTRSLDCAVPCILERPLKNSSVSMPPSPSSSNSNSSRHSSGLKSSSLNFMLNSGSLNAFWNSAQSSMPSPSASIIKNKFLISVSSLCISKSFCRNAMSWSCLEVLMAFSTMIAVTKFISTKTATEM